MRLTGDAMKLNKKMVSGVFMFMIVVVGCNTLASETLTSTPILMSTPVSAVSSTEMSNVVESPMPTATATESTPIPTFSSIESESYVRELLEGNAGCDLPCVWGIVPGKTSYIEAQRFFESLGWKGSESHGAYYTGKDLESVSLLNRVGIYAENGVVEKMHIEIGGKDFLGLVKYFSFENILQVYGKPVEVLVFIGVNPDVLEPDETSFELLLYYQSKNILIQYAGIATKVGNGYHFCPSRPNAESTQVDPLSGNVSLYVGEESQTSTPETLVQPFWTLPNYYISAEKAFGMSVDEFYETVSQNDGEACFDSSLDAWRR